MVPAPLLWQGKTPFCTLHALSFIIVNLLPQDFRDTVVSLVDIRDALIKRWREKNDGKDRSVPTSELQALVQEVTFKDLRGESFQLEVDMFNMDSFDAVFQRVKESGGCARTLISSLGWIRSQGDRFLPEDCGTHMMAAFCTDTLGGETEDRKVLVCRNSYGLKEAECWVDRCNFIHGLAIDIRHVKYCCPEDDDPSALMRFRLAERRGTSCRSMKLIDATDDAKALASLGVVKRLKGDLTGAFDALDQSLLLDTTAWALKHRGEVKRLKKDYDGAVKDFDDSLQLEPSNAWALGNRGEAKRRGGDYIGALDDLDRALDLDPCNTFALRCRGDVKRMLGDYAGALMDLDIALDQDPSSSWAYASRAEVRRCRGDNAGALRDFDKAVQIDPKNDFALSGRVDLKRTMGKYSSAMAQDMDKYLMQQGQGASQWLRRLRPGKWRSTCVCAQPIDIESL